MNLEKHIWEGRTVGDFIKELEVVVDMIMTNNSWMKPFTNKKELKKWCMNNQPSYKKHIPEVVNHFAKIYKLN